MRTARTQHLVNIWRAQIFFLVGAVSLSVTPVLAQAPPERLSDRDVKALIEQVDQERDKFEGNLDDSLKGSVLRTATAEVKVSAALQDYQDNVKKLKERFTPDYSASAEVATVLKQAAAFDKFMRESPTVTKGRSEWDREAASLMRLAAAYGTTFPMPEEAIVRRMNDKEVAGAANDIAQAANRIKSEFDKVPDTALPKPEKAAIKKDVELLGKQANVLKSRLNDGKPATAEMQLLLAQVAVVQKILDSRPNPGATVSWGDVQKSLAKLHQAFGLKQ
jgi:hypothetical protein